jgi:UDP-N-acetylmuramate dehydrogenase
VTDALEALRPWVAKAAAQEPLSRHSTFAIGGPADVYAEVADREQLKRAAAWARERKLPLFPIGQGSNLLVGDGGIRGVVVRLRGDFEKISFDGAAVTAGAGAALPALAREAAKRGLSGAEAFVGIPGTVGGGLMTNAGTPEGDLGSLVESVDLFSPDGAEETWGRDELSFGYRRSNLSGRLVLSARLRLKPGEARDIMALVEKQLARRAERQPLGTFNCGSVFKNPPGDHAARLIEACGLKGRRIGGARISPKHANFIENTDKAAARDVKALMALARQAVKEKFSVDLEPEVWTVGEDA